MGAPDHTFLNESFCDQDQGAIQILVEEDVRAMVRLLGHVAALPGDHADKKRALMEGLCELIQADAWVWTLACQLEPDKQPVYVAFMHGGFSEERFARYLNAMDHPDMAWLTAPMAREIQERKTHLTRLRQQIDPGNRFITSAAYPLWGEADIGPLLLSIYPLDERSASGIGLYRGRDAAPFTPRESRIAHIVLSEIPWLHQQGWPEDRGANVPLLSPRQRLVLNLLLEGRSRKEIADHLGISIHTVAGYAKEVYAYFQVQSHAELMARFFSGNGGDVV